MVCLTSFLQPCVGNSYLQKIHSCSQKIWQHNTGLGNFAAFAFIMLTVLLAQNSPTLLHLDSITSTDEVVNDTIWSYSITLISRLLAFQLVQVCLNILSPLFSNVSIMVKCAALRNTFWNDQKPKHNMFSWSQPGVACLEVPCPVQQCTAGLCGHYYNAPQSTQSVGVSESICTMIYRSSFWFFVATRRSCFPREANHMWCQ